MSVQKIVADKGEIKVVDLSNPENRKYYDMGYDDGRRNDQDNASTRGYLIITMKNLGYSTKDIDKALKELRGTFDNFSVQEAKDQFYNGTY